MRECHQVHVKEIKKISEDELIKREVDGRLDKLADWLRPEGQRFRSIIWSQSAGVPIVL